MPIVATGSEPLPLRAWASLRLVLWFYGSQLAIAVAIVVVVMVGAGLRGHPVRMLSTEALLLATTVATIGSAWVVLRHLRATLAGGAMPAIVAALGWRATPLRPVLAWAAVGTLFSYGWVHLVVERLLPPTSQDLTTVSSVFAVQSLAGRGLLFAFAVGLAPPVEEFVFRGVLLTGLATSWGSLPGIAGSTALFALGHLDQVGSYWPAFLGIVCIGLMTAALRLRYRSLYPGWALHAAYNATALLMAFGGS